MVKTREAKTIKKSDIDDDSEDGMMDLVPSGGKSGDSNGFRSDED